MSTNYSIPAMPLWMGIADIKAQQDRENEKDRMRVLNCPVCETNNGDRTGSSRYKELIKCNNCNELY
jgi:hypothetical protein